MDHSLVKYLGSQPVMKVLRGLLLAPGPRHIRDLASQYSYSPAGVSDILRRLKKVGALKEVRRGNRRCFALNVPPRDLACLKDFFHAFERALLEERAARFSRVAAKRLQWMDQAYEFYRDVKRSRHDPS